MHTQKEERAYDYETEEIYFFRVFNQFHLNAAVKNGNGKKGFIK